jgi:hypothetical protein
LDSSSRSSYKEEGNGWSIASKPPRVRNFCLLVQMQEIPNPGVIYRHYQEVKEGDDAWSQESKL